MNEEQEILKDEQQESFLDRNIGNIVLFTLGTIFTLYLVYSWYFPEPMPDCGYSDQGCHGENRWGQ